jgi:hypothetical protein
MTIVWTQRIAQFNRSTLDWNVVGLTSDAIVSPAGCECHLAARRTSAKIDDARVPRTSRTRRLPQPIPYDLDMESAEPVTPSEQG